VRERGILRMGVTGRGYFRLEREDVDEAGPCRPCASVAIRQLRDDEFLRGG